MVFVMIIDRIGYTVTSILQIENHVVHQKFQHSI